MPNQLLSNGELSRNLKGELERSNILIDQPGTYTHSLITPFINNISSVNTNVLNYYNRGILELATDEDLTEKASEFGVNRGFNNSLVDTSQNNFNVFITNGTASEFALDTSQPIVIPKTNLTIRDNDGNEYVALSNIVIQPDAFAGFTGISAASSQIDNVPPNTINTVFVVVDDNITNLNPAKADEIEFGCNNNRSITSDGVVATDQLLRRRAFLRINAMNNTNIDALRLALEQYGITEVTFLRDHFGFGTLGLIVRVGESPLLSQESLTKLNNIVTNIVPFARVIVPESLIVRFTLEAQFDDGSQVAETKDEIYGTVQDYFDNLDLGQSINPTDIESAIANIENVLKIKLRCMSIDGRKCNVRKQFALQDQIFVLDDTDPITYTA